MDYAFTVLPMTPSHMSEYHPIVPAPSMKLLPELRFASGMFINFMSQNMLKLNSDKTEIIILGTDATHAKIDVTQICVGDCTVRIEGKPVSNLGVTFDPGLTLKEQVNRVVKSCNYYLRNIMRMRKFLTREATIRTIVTLELSRLDYCNALLSGLPKKLIKKLQLVQNSAARVVYVIHKRDHISPALADLHWLKVVERVDFKILLLTFKALHGRAPAYIRDLVSPHSITRELRSIKVTDRLREVLPCLPTYGGRAFSFYAPKLWNSLPNHVRESRSVDVFKKKLKTFLYKMSFPDS